MGDVWGRMYEDACMAMLYNKACESGPVRKGCPVDS